MSLKRTGTRKATAGASSRAKGYEMVQQGVQVLYPGEDEDIKSDIDIVFVPGLGAHPHDSWKSTKTEWSWMTSADGIRGAFPKARILLYTYESAWQGQLKVSQFMDNISKTLLVALRSRRENCKKRPIVFIGHSMGGLVIAKAITILNAQPELCPVMFETISAAVFFGTPFAGAPAAAWASMYAYWAEKWNKATTSELLEMMKPGDETLRELKDEFRRVAAKTKYKIELLCFWEEQQTDFTKIAHLPGLFGFTKRLIPKDVSEFVSKTSATFEGDVPKYGLASNHRELVKFESAKDGRWNFVENLLKKVIHGAYLTAKNRLSAARDIEWDSFKGVMEALDSARVHPSRLRKFLVKNPGKSALITQEDDYIKWLGKPASGNHPPSESAKVDGIWIRGPEGRGKTGVMLAALDDVENLARIAEQENGEQILFAYFLCDAGKDYCTAEDCLKSLVWQLIEQEKALTTHAKDFVKEKGKNGGVKSRATATVENLWKALQGMLADEFAGSRVYIILSNVHLLPEDSDSTLKLLKLLSLELEGNQITEPSRVMTKWLITSRPTYAVQTALDLERLRVINLEDERFGNQFQKTLQKHAKSKVEKLETDKKYNKALAWFARSLIGERAQNTSWIDITCLQLEELPEAESELKVRRMLEAMPQELDALLKNAWLQIFRTAGEYGENVREMLRALILTIEEPEEAELAVLCGQDGSDDEKQELRRSIEKCKPLVSVKRTVCFMNSAVKKHLIDNAKELLDLSPQEIARQHGLLSLRSLSYLKHVFGFPETEAPPTSDSVDGDKEGSDADAADSDDGSEDGVLDIDTESEAGGDFVDYDENSNSDDDDVDDDDWDEESEPDADPEARILEDLNVFPYMVKNWLKHGSKSTVGFADDLSIDDEFWKFDSLFRRRWLVEYNRNTKEFENEDIRGMNALHLVAAIGFRQLLIALIENGHEDEVDGLDGLKNTPLCFACHFGNSDMVEELLDRKANINAGQEEKEDTPLHLAAEEGHVGVMKKLILRGASLNAYSQYSGLVIHSAISSGNFDAVELLVHHGVSLSIDHDNLETPLEQAASLSDVSMLEYLMEKYADQLSPQEYSKALIAAAVAGSLEILNKLLPFEHSENDYQSALDEAAGEGNWEITKVLLEKRANLSCDNIFYKAATTTDDLEVLEALWEYTNGNISADTIDQSLYNTTDNKKTDTVQLLLMKFGADANAQGDDYGNALTASAYDGTLDILKLLLDHGATVNSDDGWALQTAATEGHVDVVKELLSRDANVNARTSNPGFPQQTALQGACELGRAEIVDILLEHGADPNLGGGEDAYPIITAARNGQAEIIGKLIFAHADVNVVGGDDGSTALIAVARKVASLEPLQQLLDAGAEIDATDNNGDTALIAAASVNDDEFVNFLLAKGADVMHKNKDGLNAMQVAYDTDNTGETLSVLINHVSIILSGVKKAIQTGNRAIISVANDARAAAREANNNDIKGDGPQAGSDYPTDADATSSRSKSEKDEFEDLLAEHDSKSYPENRFLKDTDSSQKNDELSHAEVMSNTQDIRREGKDSEMDVDHGTQLEPADQTYTIQNLEYSDIKASSKFSSSSVLQHHPVHIDIHTGPTGGPGYPDTAAATEPGMQNGTDQSVHHNPSQRLNTWHQQPGTDYNIHHGPSYEKYQQVNETSQILAVMPQLDREAPVRRKPAPTAYIGVHHSQDLANINNTISQAVNPSEHRPSSFAAYNPETRQPVSKSSSQTSSSQAQVFGQYQSAHRPPGIQQSFEPGSLTVPHTQSQARDRPVEDHHYGEGLRSSSDQMHRGNHIVHHIPGHPTQTHNSFSQQKNEYPPRPQPIQAYSAPPQLQQQQQQIRSGNDTYYAMPPDSRYPISSSSQLYQNANISEQTQYEWPDQPKSRTPSFFGVKNTFNQARGKLFSTNKSDDSGR